MNEDQVNRLAHTAQEHGRITQQLHQQNVQMRDMLETVMRTHPRQTDDPDYIRAWCLEVFFAIRELLRRLDSGQP